IISLGLAIYSRGLRSLVYVPSPGRGIHRGNYPLPLGFQLLLKPNRLAAFGGEGVYNSPRCLFEPTHILGGFFTFLRKCVEDYVIGTRLIVGSDKFLYG